MTTYKKRLRPAKAFERDNIITFEGDLNGKFVAPRQLKTYLKEKEDEIDKFMDKMSFNRQIRFSTHGNTSNATTISTVWYKHNNSSEYIKKSTIEKMFKFVTINKDETSL